MASPDLLMVCVSSFLAVFSVLVVLAIIIRIIVILFPVKTSTADVAVTAAIVAAISQRYPGAAITRIEEKQ